MLSLSVVSLMVVESVVVVFESLLLLQEMIVKMMAERRNSFFTIESFNKSRESMFPISIG